MKKLSLIPALLFAAALFAQDGYEIKVTLKPFKNEYIYLGHYSGKQYPIDDSVKLNDKSEGVFKGTKKLGGGIYIVVFPAKNRFFEILLDEQQRFSVIADTATLLQQKTFVNSPDNELFEKYQHYMAVKGKSMDSLKNKLALATAKEDSTHLNEALQKINKDVSLYRKDFTGKNPNSLLSTLFHLMEEPKVPPAEEQPGGKYDSAFAYRYFKDHYWDGIYFWDDRVTRTPASLFEERLDKYYNTLVYPDADSVIKELDKMLGFATASKEMSRYLLVKFITRYLNMKYMWEDRVYTHLYEKYFSQKEYDWLTPQGKKMITDRYYSLVANIMGKPAENIMLPDTAGKTKVLYETASPFTIVCFWDPTCGHCKETLPVLDSMYRAKWKAEGVTIYAVAKETDGSKKDWMNFIHGKHLEDWTHVYYSKEEEKKRVDNNIPGYSQLYDVQSFPTIYLLDKDKRIMAKKLTWEQIDEILNEKRKAQSQ